MPISNLIITSIAGSLMLKLIKKMKKYLSLIAFAVMAVFSLTFVSCGDDDEEPSFGFDQIEINGTKQELFSTLFSWEDMTSILGLDLDDNYAMFGFGLMNGDGYILSCQCPYEPKKGDVISNMKNFVVEPDITGQKKGIKYPYVSGTAKIVDTNVSKEELTLKLENVKFEKDGKSYTFNGQITSRFSFSELQEK